MENAKFVLLMAMRMLDTTADALMEQPEQRWILAVRRFVTASYDTRLALNHMGRKGWHENLKVCLTCVQNEHTATRAAKANFTLGAIEEMFRLAARSITSDPEEKQWISYMAVMMNLFTVNAYHDAAKLLPKLEATTE